MSASGKVSIRQVADAAGVSPATVSLVFNERAGVAADTRERVLAAGARLGYQPGWISKVFRSGRTFVLGVVVSHGGTVLWEQTYLPYYQGVIAGAALEALEHGYSITAIRACSTGELIGPIPPDGILVIDPGDDDPVITHALENGLAVVAVGGHPSEMSSPRLRSAPIETKTGVPAALDALLAQGSTAPAFIRGSIDDAYTNASQESYLSWCEQQGIKSLVYVLEPGQTPIDGARAFFQNAKGDYDAAYCINESYGTAMAVAAGEQQLLIPNEFSIAVAAEPHLANVDPRLLYVEFDTVLAGATATKLLVALLEGKEPESVSIPFHLKAENE